MKDFFTKYRRRIIGVGSLLLLFVSVAKDLPYPIIITIGAGGIIVLMFEGQLFGE